MVEGVKSSNDPRFARELEGIVGRLLDGPLIVLVPSEVQPRKRVSPQATSTRTEMFFGPVGRLS